MIVVDASALLAFLFGENGADEVRTVLSECCMSSVNLSEVLGRFARDGHDVHPILTQLLATTVEFVPFREAEAAAAAALVPATRTYGLSLGDRACLSLANLRQLPVLTADRVWSDLDLGLEIRQIRA